MQITAITMVETNHILNKPVTLLQVDDDPIFNAVCEQHFKSHRSWNVIHETSLESTEVRLRQAPSVDVLMLDLCLPGRNGIEFLETLRDMNFSGKLIIVSSQPVDVIRMASMLATSFALNLVAQMEKPFTPAKLAALDLAISSDVTR